MYCIQSRARIFILLKSPNCASMGFRTEEWLASHWCVGKERGWNKRFDSPIDRYCSETNGRGCDENNLYRSKQRSNCVATQWRAGPAQTIRSKGKVVFPIPGTRTVMLQKLIDYNTRLRKKIIICFLTFKSDKNPLGFALRPCLSYYLEVSCVFG